MPQVDWTIRSAWDGEPTPAGKQVQLSLAWDDARAELQVEASFHDDPPPPGPPGAHPGLWDFEVVELSRLGGDERYLGEFAECCGRRHDQAAFLASPLV